MRGILWTEWLAEHGHLRGHGVHNLGLKIGHIVHDERFWPIVIAIALVGMLVTLFVLAAIYSDAGNEPLRPVPYAPYF